ncbi:MAG: polysaccharide deacetylase family protein [Candidatus Falkowbacteria bacterium]|nr:polysaccharide deacetylase family protein [Candidatus Falkowbacteria bacterium]
MEWINFLHLYQPMNADAVTIKEATEKSYYRIVRALEENPKIKFTLNINGCLLVRWDELGFHDIIKKINILIKQGKIELTSTAAYHPLLPLISSAEVKRQIADNEKIIKKYFGNYKPRGFFLPELAYSEEVAKIIKSFKYKWIILDEIALNGKLNQVDFKQVYLDKNSGLKIIFRSRHIDHTAEFEKLLKAEKLKTLTVSEFIDATKETTKISPVACSWESTAEELKHNQPYILWYDKSNKIQLQLWRLARLAYDIVEKHKSDKNYLRGRWHLVRGLASCTFWWASGRNLGPFSPIAWSPDEIERGINELVHAVRCLNNKKLSSVKIRTEKLVAQIRRDIWIKHWQKN